MARKSKQVKRIEARRAELEAELHAARERAQQLEQEYEDLATAERVLATLAGPSEQDTDFAPPIPKPPEFSEPADASDDTVGAELTIGDMALHVLKEAGSNGLSSNEILKLIRERWKADLMRSSLSPPLSRLRQREVVTLDGDNWKLRQNENAPPTESSGAETGEIDALAQQQLSERQPQVDPM